jgi:hypothetical protein
MRGLLGCPLLAYCVEKPLGKSGAMGSYDGVLEIKYKLYVLKLS